MILPVYLYDQPILKQKAKKIEELTDEVVQFSKDMLETMYVANGIGLAANQVGSRFSMTVIDLTGMDDIENFTPMTLINPVIESYSEEKSEFEEGCLSLPKFREFVTRPTEIQVRFMDIDMKEHSMQVGGLLARVMQHEIDHLNGVYFFERISPLKRAMAHSKLKKIQLGLVATDYEVKLHKTTLPKKR